MNHDELIVQAGRLCAKEHKVSYHEVKLISVACIMPHVSCPDRFAVPGGIIVEFEYSRAGWRAVYSNSVEDPSRMVCWAD